LREVARPLDRIRAIGRDVVEAELLVEALRFDHRGKSVEDDLSVPDRPGLAENARDEGLADAEAPSARPHVQALHLRSRRTRGAQGHASDRRVLVRGEEEPAAGRSVGTGEPLHLFLEALKAEVDAE